MESTTEESYDFDTDWIWKVIGFSLLGCALIAVIIALTMYCCSISGTLWGCKLRLKKKPPPQATPVVESFDPTKKPGLNRDGSISKTKSSSSVTNNTPPPIVTVSAPNNNKPPPVVVPVSAPKPSNKAIDKRQVKEQKDGESSSSSSSSSLGEGVVVLHKCDYCVNELFFEEKDRLKHYLMYHLDQAHKIIRPELVCSIDYCDYVGKTELARRRHEQRKHRRDAPPGAALIADLTGGSCLYCNTTISNTTFLKEHMLKCTKRDHRPFLGCSTCHKSFHFILDFIQHLQARGGIAHGSPILLKK